MEAWLAEPNLMQADSDAEYHTIININMDHIKVGRCSLTPSIPR